VTSVHKTSLNNIGDVEVIRSSTDATSIMIAVCVPVRRKTVGFHQTKQ